YIGPCLRAGRWGKFGFNQHHCGAADTPSAPQAREVPMTKRSLYSGVAALAIVAFLAAAPTRVIAQTAVAIDNDDIGGVVKGPNGPEAGVWVIAETTELPTKYAKMVVTDDQGRYVIPQLPKVGYSVWSRGYGLKDSTRTEAMPGNVVNIKAFAATPQEDAE